MKKEPLRKCLATNERLAKKDLIRVVRNNEGKIFKVQPFKDMKSKALVNKRSKMNVNINNCSNRTNNI